MEAGVCAGERGFVTFCIYVGCLSMNTVKASSEILKIYQTGDRPVLVLCADGYHYICKYKLPGGTANKLVNELMGYFYAKVWGLKVPYMSFVVNDSIIWRRATVSHDPVAPLIGSRKMENVCDLSEINCDQVRVAPSTLKQLLRIALFDFWLSNEDRTCNNYNLLYDLRKDEIISIDYGGILNSGVMGTPVSQLDESDSILSSDLYERLKGEKNPGILESMYTEFIMSVDHCKQRTPSFLRSIPKEWHADLFALEAKLGGLFTLDWLNDTWDNFCFIARLS